MKKSFHLLFLLVIFSTVSCSGEYDDTAIRNDISDLTSRVQNLEKLCKDMNTNISSLQTLVDALQQNDYITEITPIMENGKEIGYTIKFLNHTPITIYHGKDGDTFKIGVKQDIDGLYYWVLDEEWLLDTSNNKVQAQGVTPKLKIENEYWYVSYDNETSWVQLGKATVSGGNSIFEEIDTKNDDFVTFKLINGTTFSVPKCHSIDIYFNNTKGIILVPEVPQEIPYTLIGTSADVQVEALGSNGIEVEVSSISPTEGMLIVTASGNISRYSKAVVFLNDKGNTFFRTLTFEEGVINISNEVYECSYIEGIITIPVETNLDYTYTIEETAKNWIQPITKTRSLHTENLQFTIAKNTGGIRTATILFTDTKGRIQRDITILQNSESTSTEGFTEVNGNEATIYMDKAADAQTVAKAIKDLDEKGIVKYIMKGTYKMLGINSTFNPENPFKEAPNVEEIDFSEVTSWEKVTSYLFQAQKDEYSPIYYQSLRKIILPESVTEISSFAFEGCTSLNSINLSNITTINGSAFRGCSSLASIEIPKVETIEGSTFRGCSSLKSIELPKVTIIKSYAFQDCISLNSINLSNVITIKDGAFWGCSSLTSIDIPNITTIESSTFRNCSSLISVELPNVEIIKSGAFSDCSSLTSMELPNVTMIGNQALFLCTSLSELKLTSENDIQTEFSWIESYRANVIRLYLNPNKQDQVKNGNGWGNLIWESINYINK